MRPSTLGYAEQTTKPPLDECFILTLTVRVSPYIIISKLKEDSRGDGQRIDNWSFDYTDFVVGDSLGKKKAPGISLLKYEISQNFWNLRYFEQVT